MILLVSPLYLNKFLKFLYSYTIAQTIMQFSHLPANLSRITSDKLRENPRLLLQFITILKVLNSFSIKLPISYNKKPAFICNLRDSYSYCIYLIFVNNKFEMWTKFTICWGWYWSRFWLYIFFRGIGTGSFDQPKIRDMKNWIWNDMTWSNTLKILILYFLKKSLHQNSY